MGMRMRIWEWERESKNVSIVTYCIGTQVLSLYVRTTNGNQIHTKQIPVVACKGSWLEHVAISTLFFSEL